MTITTQIGIWLSVCDVMSSLSINCFIQFNPINFPFYPPKLDFPMPLPRLYDVYHIACMTYHKIFYELQRIDTIFLILYIHNY